jgi:hypothetical protein
LNGISKVGEVEAGLSVGGIILVVAAAVFLYGGLTLCLRLALKNKAKPAIQEATPQ